MGQSEEKVIYPWGDERRFYSYPSYFREIFGGRVQKVAVNAGFTCPNRDGTLGVGGCTFCNNNAFTPSYCMEGEEVAWQIEEGIEFHSRRYRRVDNFLAYFQSFSNTYGPLEKLKEVYDVALSFPEVIGIVVGTRPDCIDDQKLDYFKSLMERGKYVTIEYGVESCYDKTLEEINRGHNFATAVDAIKATAERGINVGAHFILGLPGESEQMLIDQIDWINELPLTTIKFHQLQIFKGTAMAKDYSKNPDRYKFWELDEYIDLFIEVTRRLRPDIVIERFASEAPPRFHAGPTWGRVRNHELIRMFEQRLEELNTFQGELYLAKQK